MKIALLSNITVDILAADIKKNSHDVYTPAGFDTWQQELIMQNSNLYKFKPDVIIIIIHANSYPDSWTEIKTGENLINDWIQNLKILSENSTGIPVFISSIDVNDFWNSTALFASQIRLNKYFENYFNEKIESLHKEFSNLYVLPVKDLIEKIGRDNFYSKKMWYLASMPYSLKAVSGISDLILRYISPVKNARKKCLAVDLDNTLWGGVIGEDGVNGISLSNSKEGSIYKDVQRILKKMKNQGVMLTILSKNNIDDVIPVFSLPDMILKRDDFVAESINWNPKTQNIKQLADDLNIGLDSFVFLDDNPMEREQMKSECPEVTVIDFPSDVSKLPETVNSAYEKYFFTLDITGEDTKKTSMYRSEIKRKEVLKNSDSVSDFLKKLEMKINIHFMQNSEELRVTQLINKTNQFNLTTKRYTQEEIHNFAINPDSDILTVHISDKYGEQGLISVLILKYLNDEVYIDSFIMSCRVMGRNAEFEIISYLKNILTKKNISKIKASYIKTPKNSPVENLYENLGFKIINSTDKTKNYEIIISDLPESTGLFEKCK